VFKCSKEKLQAAMDDPDKGLNFVYNGYSWKTGWNGGVYHAQFTNGTGKESNMHKMKDDGAVKKYLKDMPVDFRNGPDPNFFNDGRLRFILRYKTGKQLGGGKYHEKTAISNVVGEYVYNEMHKVNLNDNPEVTTQDGDVHPNQDANDPADVKNPQTGIISKPIADVQRHDIGEVVAKNGRIYNSVEEAKKDGTEAVAMIAAMKWESDEVSGKYTGAYPVQMYQIYYKVTHAVAIGFEDIPLTSMPFSTDNTALEASKVDAEWVKAHTVPGATWCQMDSYTLQRMLIECGDKDPIGGQDNLIYCLDDIKKKTEAGLDDYTSYYRTPQATPCELSKKLAECGVNFSGNSKWATNEQDVVFILSRQDQGFDIAFNLRKYETSSHCRFYLKW